MLKVSGPESTSTGQDDQICAGLKAGIDITVHRVQDIWDTKSTTEYWRFILVDVKTLSTRSIELEFYGHVLFMVIQSLFCF